MLKISNNVSIPDAEIEWQAVHAQGPGGQNVNKVASAVHLRFDIPASSLPPAYKECLMNLQDQRLTTEGVIVIKAQRHRSQDKNRQDALRRLRHLIIEAMKPRPRRKPTRPSRAARRRRLERKKQRGRVKALRGRVRY